MARPVGSKVVECPKCKKKIVAKVSETGRCHSCGTKVRFTQKLMRQLGKKID